MQYYSPETVRGKKCLAQTVLAQDDLQCEEDRYSHATCSRQCLFFELSANTFLA